MSDAFTLLGGSALAALITIGLKKRRDAVASRPAEKPHKKLVFGDPNTPADAEGRVYHLGIKTGEVANRILSVGDAGRAERIAALLDGGGPKLRVGSSRGFVTHTGTYKGVPVSIIATGMGYPMMDFVVRETRPLLSGPVAMIRYGTCGGLRAEVGNIVVAGEGACFVHRDPDAVADLMSTGAMTAGDLPADAALPFLVSGLVKPNEDLSSLLFANMGDALKAAGLAGTATGAASGCDYKVLMGANASACSFYSSQGRTNNSFFDYNETLVSHLESKFPQLRTLEMETFHLFDLARASKPHARIYATAAAIVLANRHSKSVVSKEDMITLEKVGGKAALESLIAFQM